MTSPLSLFAGFDGGGSKTACTLCDISGRILGEGEGGPSNYLYCGEDTALSSMQAALWAAFREARLAPAQLEAAYVSSAAIRTYDGEKHKPFFARSVDARRLVCEGDIYPIWYAGARGEPAVVCIVGTGAITYLFRGSDYIRVSGWGPLLGDEGSGYDIGLSAARLAMHMHDGRAEMEEAFFRAVLAHFEVAEARLMIGAVKTDDARKRIASLARTVCILSAHGSPSANRLLDDAAEETLSSVRAALKRDGQGDCLPLILSGGLVTPGSLMTERITRLARSEARILRVTPIDIKPSRICAALALREAGENEAAEMLLAKAGGQK